MIVYCATNKITKDQYIGITISTLEGRMYGHHRAAEKGLQFHFHRAIRKYGKESFEWSILDHAVNIDQLKVLEKDYIQKLKPRYNMTQEGDQELKNGLRSFVKKLLVENVLKRVE